MRRLSLPALATVGVLVAGCGPIEYINQVGSRASTAVADAQAARAMEYAPYEMTCAEQYLHQAREEGAYAHYQASIEYGKKAIEKAQQARAIARDRQAQTPGAMPAALTTGQPISGGPAPSESAPRSAAP